MQLRVQLWKAEIFISIWNTELLTKKIKSKWYIVNMGDSYRVAAAVSASVPASNLDAALCVLRTASLQLLLLLQMLLFNSTKLDKVTFSN